MLIVAGCGIHNDGEAQSHHDGIHTFHVGKDARLRYVEKHFGEGAARVAGLNPTTEVDRSRTPTARWRWCSSRAWIPPSGPPPPIWPPGPSW